MYTAFPCTEVEAGLPTSRAADTEARVYTAFPCSKTEAGLPASRAAGTSEHAATHHPEAHPIRSAFFQQWRQRAYAAATSATHGPELTGQPTPQTKTGVFVADHEYTQPRVEREGNLTQFHFGSVRGVRP